MGGEFYRRTFEAAAGSSPDMVVITSFNEWPEGSHLEPSAEFGNFYLDLTKQYVNGFKFGTGFPAPPPFNQAPAPAPSATTQPPTPISDSGSQNSESVASSPTPIFQSPTPISQPATPLPEPTASFQSPTPARQPLAANPQAEVQSFQPVLPTPTPLADGRIRYVAAPGDSFINIADRFDVSVDLLYAYNELNPATAVLQDGQVLTVGFTESYTGTRYIAGYPQARILPDGRVVHIVQVGDTLVSIAVRNELTLEELYQRSGLNGESFLQLNQQVLVARTPIAENVGGSTNVETATFVPTETPIPTETLTPLPTQPIAIVQQTLPPPPTSVPTVAQPTVPATSAPIVISPTVTPMPATDPVDPKQYLPLFFAGIALLLGAGGVFLYLGRK